MNRKTTRKQIKIKEEEITEVLLELEKDLSNFQLSVEKKDKTIQQYARLLKLTKIKYQKIYEENKKLREKIKIKKKKESISKKQIVSLTPKKEKRNRSILRKLKSQTQKLLKKHNGRKAA